MCRKVICLTFYRNPGTKDQATFSGGGGGREAFLVSVTMSGASGALGPVRPLEGMHLGRREGSGVSVCGARVSCRQRLDVWSPLPPSRLQPLSLLDCPVPLRQLQMEACRDERSSGSPHRRVPIAQRSPGQRHPSPSKRRRQWILGPLQPGLPARPSAAAGTREPPGPHTAGYAGACSCPLLLSPKLCLSGWPQSVMEPRTRSPPRSCKKP